MSIAAIIERCRLYLRHTNFDGEQVSLDSVQEKAQQVFPELASSYALHVVTGILATQVHECGIDVTWPNPHQDFTAPIT